MHTKRVSIVKKDGSRLAGIVDRPVDQAPIAHAVFAHCFTCSKDYKAPTYISRALAAEGIAVLRFDFTGMGESEGEPSESTFSANVEDVVEAAAYLERAHEPPKLLIGHSLGGAAVLKAAARVDSVAAVVSIAAPSSLEHVSRLFEGSREEIERRGHAMADVAGRKFKITKDFLDDLEEADLRSAIAALDRALMILHSPVDRVVGIDNAADIFKAAKHPKSFVSLDRADHLLSGAEDARYAAAVIAGWSRRYVGDPQEARKRATRGDNRTVVRTGGDGFRTEILANGHPLIADEPESVGGTNTGPTPYELLTASLGACTSMTLRMYADRKGWPLDGVEVRLDHAKVHCEDCAEAEKGSSKIDRITREITLEGDLDDEQKRRLLEIADRCPVHRTLHSDIEVVTSLADSESPAERAGR